MQPTVLGYQNKESIDWFLRQQKQPVCVRPRYAVKGTVINSWLTNSSTTHTHNAMYISDNGESHFINEDKAPTTRTTLNANSYNTLNTQPLATIFSQPGPHW